MGRLGPAAGLLGGAVAAVYLGLIDRQDGGVGARVWFVAGSLLGAALAVALVPAFRSSRMRAGASAWAAATFSAWAVLASLSIGALLVPAAVVAWAATRAAGCQLPRAEAIGIAVGTAAVSFAVTACGLVLT